MFAQDILLYQSLEDRQVPDVDNPQSYSARNQEGERQDTKVEEVLIVHPSNDDDPDEECGDVKPSIPDVLHGSMVCGSNEVEDSSLVEDCIDLSDKAENCKSHSLLCD